MCDAISMRGNILVLCPGCHSFSEFYGLRSFLRRFSPQCFPEMRPPPPYVNPPSPHVNPRPHPPNLPLSHVSPPSLRVKPPPRGLDITYNYGTFDFEAGHFVLKFLHGNLDYTLSAYGFEASFRAYQSQGRPIIQTLNLAPAQQQRLLDLLAVNLPGKPPLPLPFSVR